MSSSPSSSCTIPIAGESIDLLPERAACWTARRTLIVSDLHLGKCETLRSAGMPIPTGVIERDLDRLAAAVARTNASRVLVVGDLIHHGSGLTPACIDLVARFRRDTLAGVELSLIRGNHDRRIEPVLEKWGVTELPAAHLEAPFGFAHDPADGLVTGATCTWFGHLHPLCRVGTGSTAFALPCFVVDVDHILLPAFSRFTRGMAIPIPPDAAAYAVAEDRVLCVPTVSAARRRPSCLDAGPG